METSQYLRTITFVKPKKDMKEYFKHIYFKICLITFFFSIITPILIYNIYPGEKSQLYISKVIASYDNGKYNIVTKNDNGVIKDFVLSKEDFLIYKAGTYFCFEVSPNEFYNIYHGFNLYEIMILSFFVLLFIEGTGYIIISE